MIAAIVIVLLASAVGLGSLIVAQVIKQKLAFNTGDNVLGFGIGFITDFLDTLGVGSFVTTTTLFQWAKLSSPHAAALLPTPCLLQNNPILKTKALSGI